MNENFVNILMEILQPITDVASEKIEYQGTQIITLSKNNTIFAVIIDDNLYFRKNTAFSNKSTHFVYNNHHYTIVDISRLKSPEQKDKLLEQATNAYWIASKQK